MRARLMIEISLSTGTGTNGMTWNQVTRHILTTLTSTSTLGGVQTDTISST